jgi:hypothetical protein
VLAHLYNVGGDIAVINLPALCSGLLQRQRSSLQMLQLVFQLPCKQPGPAIVQGQLQSRHCMHRPPGARCLRMERGSGQQRDTLGLRI